MIIFISFFLFYISFIYGEDTFFLSGNGSFKLVSDQTYISPQIESPLPLDTIVKTESNSSVRIRNQLGVFHISSNQNVSIKQLSVSSLLDINQKVTNHPLNQSQKVFLKESFLYLKEHLSVSKILLDYHGWNTQIEEVFDNLILHSENLPFKPKIYIIKNDSFNAFSYPTGIFLIHSKILDVIDEEIESSIELKNFKKSREYLLAGIIAHELAHYYHHDAYRSIVKFIGSLDHYNHYETNNFIKEIHFNQNQELEADLSAFFLLKKSDIHPNWMVRSLELLQKTKKHRKIEKDYFSTHPSINHRLSSLPSEKQQWYTFLFRLETLFNNIQKGVHLLTTIDELNSVLLQYPNNIYLLKAKAVGYHKLWLQTVTPTVQEFKPYLEMDSFNNKILDSIRGNSELIGDIPGNKEYYQDSIDIYKSIFTAEGFLDYSLISNYSTLLMYDKSSQAEAIKLAEFAQYSLDNLQTLNNLAIVYWKVGDRKNSEKIFNSLIKKIIKSFPKNISIPTYTGRSFHSKFDNLEDQSQIKFSLSEAFAYSTPILNIILLLRSNSPTYFLEFIYKYLTIFDSDSEWSNYLFTQTSLVWNESVTNYKNSPIEVNGISIGDKEYDLLKKWNHSSEIYADYSIFDNHYKVIYFSELDVTIRTVNSRIQSIKIIPGAEKELKLNNIPISDLAQSYKNLGVLKEDNNYYSKILFLHNHNERTILFLKENSRIISILIE